jgi:hypothetical protein
MDERDPMLFVTKQVAVSPKLVSRRCEAAVGELILGHDLQSVERR